MSSPEKHIYKLTFTVPPTHTQPCLDALFSAGAGIWPNTSHSLSSSSTSTSPPKYTNCAFVTRGVGQFLPSTNASPNIGEPGREERVEEDRVEVVVWGNEGVARGAVTELRRVHPYDVVAVYVVRCEGF